MSAPIGSESHHLIIIHWLEYCFLYQLVFITVDTKSPHLPIVIWYFYHSCWFGLIGFLLQTFYNVSCFWRFPASNSLFLSFFTIYYFLSVTFFWKLRCKCHFWRLLSSFTTRNIPLQFCNIKLLCICPKDIVQAIDAHHLYCINLWLFLKPLFQTYYSFITRHHLFLMRVYNS